MPSRRSGPTKRLSSQRMVCVIGFVVLTTFTAAGLAVDSRSAQAAVPAGFTSSPVLTGLAQPMAIEFLPDGRALVAQRFGRIFITDITANNPSSSATVLNITDLLTDGERGLLGLAADPDFSNNGYIYVYYTKASTNRGRVSRFTSSNDVATIASELLIWEDNVEALNEFHYGGGLDFGPDGRLYLTVGDKFDNPADSQNLSLSAGKILRMNPDGAPPVDNPFFGQAGVIDEIWALGLRNAFRSGWDLQSGRYFVGEVGGNRDNEPNISYEDVHLGVAGANYGWPNCEGPDLIDRDACNPPESRPLTYEPPIYSYSHDGANKAIIGGEVYNGQQFPAEYQGAYFFGDFAEWEISYIKFDGNGDVVGPHTVFETDATRVVDIAFGPDGSLYYLSLAPGAVYRISSDGAPTIDQIDATPRQGPNPLTVNFTAAATSPFGLPLTYTWDFGDGQQSTDQNPSHLYQNSGSYNAMLTVSDGEVAVNSLPIEIAVGSPPVASITTSLANGLFEAGDTINFSGTATDPDEVLDGSSFEWVVDFFHNEHTHPYRSAEPGDGGSFTIYTTGHDFHDDTGFEISLTVTDSTGLSDTDTLRVHPDKVDLLADTQPSGGVIRLDSLPLDTPLVYDTVKGFSHTIEAEEAFCDGTNRWLFSSWSDGGARQHVVSLGSTDLNLTASYVLDGDCGLPAGAVMILEADTGITTAASGRVTSWADQSGEGNDLTAVSGSPLLGITPVGMPAVDFDGIGDRLRRVGGLSGMPTGNTDRTVIVLVEHREAGWGGFGWGVRGNNRTFGVGVSNQGNFAIEGYATANNFDSGITGVGSGWTVQSAVLAGGSLSHFVDGGLIDSDNHTFNTASTFIVLGSQIDGTPQLDMSAAAAFVYPRALSSSEREQVESYLLSKYLNAAVDVQGPVIEANQAFSVVEDADLGAEIGTVLASDNVAVTDFAITAGDPDGALSISDAGILTVADPALVTAAPQFTLVVRASDVEGNGGSAIVIVDVVEPPDLTAPVIPAGQTLQTNNAVAPGVAVGTVSASDNRAVVAFTIVGGNTSEAFSIDSGGIVRVATAASLISIPQFTLAIEATDEAGNAGFGSVTVNVADVLAPTISQGQVFEMLSTAQSGEMVGLVAASDEREIAGFAITGGNVGGTFAVDPVGQVTVADPAALPTTAQFALTVEVSDGSNNVAAETVVINVSQPDTEDPVVDAGQIFQIANDAVDGDVVGTVIATDDQGVVGFVIAGGDPGGVFGIDAGGELTVVDAAGLVGVSQFVLTVSAADAAGNTGSGSVTVDVADAVDPVVIAGQVFSVPSTAINGDVVGTVTATDDRGVTGMAVTAGDPGGVFGIDAGGELTVVDATGLVGVTQFVLTVEATDAAGNSGSGSVTVDVADAVDPVVVTGQVFGVGSDAVNGDVVGTVVATDDQGVVGFAITGGDPGGVFAIDAGGVLSVADAAGLVGVTQFVLTVSATDVAGNAGSGSVTVDVADVVDPVVNTGQVFSVPEDAISGDVVGTVAATDDQGVVGFGIAGGDPAGVFAIDAGGVLSVADAAGLVGVTQFVLTVEATDGAGNTGSGSVTVDVADVVDPVVAAGQLFAVGSDAVNGDVVGTVAATDDRAVVVFGITAGDPGGVFAIDAGGLLSVADAAGLVGVTQFVLTISATDGAGNTGSGSVTVDVADAVDPIVTAGQVFSVPSTAINGDVVGSVVATDDQGVVGFAITGGDSGGVFGIDAAGELSVVDAAGLAAVTQFVLTVEATDAAGNTGSGSVTVDITDAIDPVVAAGQVFGVGSDVVNGDVVGTVVATDDRGVTGMAVTAGDPGGVFGINSAGVLSVVDVAALGAVTQFVLTVEATDAAGNTGSGSVTVNVTDAVDPVVTAGQVFSVSEDAISGDVVGTVTAADDQGVVSFAITGGDAGGVFAIDAAGELTVADASGLVVVTQFVLTVEATDAAGNTGSGLVTVDIADAVDPVVVAGQVFSVPSTALNGDVVGTVTATDDRGVTGMAVTAGDPGGVFAIDPAGVLSVADASGLAGQGQFVLTVSATDGAGNTGSGSVTVDVADAVDPVVTAGQVFSVPEDAVIGDVVGTVTATDDQGVTGFAITGGDSGGVFGIDAAGELTVVDASGLTGQGQFVLTVEATDAAGNTGSGSVTVNVADVVDPVVAAGQVFGVGSDAANGDVVGTVTATDDRGVTGMAVTAGDPGGGFAIDAAGELTVADASGLVGVTQFVLTVEATDAAGNTGSGSVTVNVTDAIDPVVSAGQLFSVPSTAINGDVVGTVVATDDRGVTGMAVAAGDPGGVFAIDPSGELSVVDASGLVGVTQFVLTVEATDAAGNTGSGSVTVNVTDAVDPVVVAGQVFSVAEDAVIGHVVGTVTATDDQGVVGFAITAGDAGGVFAIDAAGELTVADASGLVGVTQFVLSVEATDAAGNTGSGSVTVNVADVVNPVVVAGQVFGVGSDAVNGDVVGTVAATDDQGVVGFAITAGDAGGVFGIDAAGELSVVDAAGLAAVTQFVLTVEATDAAGNTGSGSVTVNVTDAFDPVVTAGQVFGVGSDAVNGDVVGTVAATDDQGVVGFAITGGDPGGVFTIDAAGELTVADASGLVGVTQFVLSVEATDAAGNTGSGSVTVNVADSEDPIVPAGQVFSVPSTAINGDVVGAVVATDDQGVVGFTITAGDAGGVFAIDAAGVLSVADASGLAGQPQFVLTVEATDAAGNAGSGSVTVDVADSEDPVVLAGQVFGVGSDAVNGDVVGTVAATDDQGVVGFAITSGDPTAVFSIDNTGSLSVNDAGGLVGVTQFVLVIEATDAAGNAGSGQVTVDIADSEDPTIAQGQAFSVANTAPLGATVGTVTASDDRGVTGFVITGGDPGGVFTIDNLGVLTVAEPTGLATVSQFILVVEVSDAAGNTATANLTVTVDDELAPVIAPGQVFEVDVSASTGAVLGTIVVTDDLGVTGLAIIAGDSGGVFALDVSGALTVADPSGLAGTSQFNLTVQATDAAENVATEQVTVDVTQAPSIPAGAVLVLEGDSGITVDGSGIVTAWADQSDQGNDLDARTGDPRLTTSPSGLPALEFDGIADRLRRVGGLSGLPTGNGDRTVFVVASHREAAWGGFGWGIRGNNRTFGVGVSAAGNFAIEGYTTPQNYDSGVAAIDQGWFVQSVVHGGDQMTHFLDGVSIDSQTHTYNTASRFIVLGAQIDGTPQLDMSAAAVIVYDRALSESERLQVESYLASKYL